MSDLKKPAVKPRTPAAQKNANTPKPEKQVVLSDGRVALCRRLKGKDIRSAGRLADGDQSKILFATAAVGTTIDGKGVTMEEIDEMDAEDALLIAGEFQHLFT